MKINNNDILRKLAIPSADNGIEFTNLDRLKQISRLLRGTNYKLIGEGNLFRLYGKRKLNKLPRDIVLVSSHVDCLQTIPFYTANSSYLHGILDNAATNAVIIALMLQNELPDNVVVGFTGDEECNFGGANELARYLVELDKLVRFVVIDVTSLGWNDKADFIIENNFIQTGYSKQWMKDIMELANHSGFVWRFVSSKADEAVGYLNESMIGNIVSKNNISTDNIVYDYVSGPNESWEYDKQGLNGFSLGLPCSAQTPEIMHGNIGFDIRKTSYINYMIFLKRLLNVWN